MYDVSPLLTKFYEDHVRLGKTRRDALGLQRDANLRRLVTGLEELRKKGNKCGSYSEVRNQGSFAMETLNQHAENDYDIDVGLIFAEAVLPATALESRNLVADALSAGGGNFAREPEARTNAVTVWYGDGHHVDFAIYRSRIMDGVAVFEHASAEWQRQDPMEVVQWFDSRVKQLSPAAQGRVAAGQLRRIVRFVKAFNRSRESWSLPGGMISTVLVVECYRPNSERDDVALFDTMTALLNRLNASVDVANPINGRSLTSKPEYAGQVRRLRGRLTDILPRLKPLQEFGCTEARARASWHAVFYHDFWRTEPSEGVADYADVGQMEIKAEVTARKDGPTLWKHTGAILPKRRHLKFTITVLPPFSPCEVRWLVLNAGDEADAAKELTHESRGVDEWVHWEQTKYKGRHRMVCEVRKDGAVVARRTIVIRVGTY